MSHFDEEPDAPVHGECAHEIHRLQAALERVEVQAQAGLCYFTLESAREYLKDIRSTVAEGLGNPAPDR